MDRSEDRIEVLANDELPHQTRLTSFEQARQYLVDGGSPATEWRIGGEYEVFAIRRGDDGQPQAPAYDGGILSVLEAMDGGWSPVREGETLIALTRPQADITLEPGGQLEMVTGVHDDATQMTTQLDGLLDELSAAAERAGVTLFGSGIRPYAKLADVPWMPKGRYRVMREYLPTKGKLAHEMMKRTATVQVSIDYADERDALDKLRCLLSTTSILTAVFANSGILDGGPIDYQSFRSAVWLQTDPDRCGLLPFVFERDDLFTAYTEWALDVPMFFVHRQGYTPAHPMTFRQFMADGFQGEFPTQADWELHLSTLFPEARLKHFIEVRGADAGPPQMARALPALVRGICYDSDACAAATSLTADLSFAQREELRVDVARRGLRATLPGAAFTVKELAKELVACARAGLERLGSPRDAELLEPLTEIAETGVSFADRAADSWRASGGDPEAFIGSLRVGGAEY